MSDALILIRLVCFCQVRSFELLYSDRHAHTVLFDFANAIQILPNLPS